MGIFRQFPYTNYHDLNLDWILNEISELINEWSKFNNDWSDWKKSVDDFIEWAKTVNIEDAVSNVLNEWYEDGKILPLIAPFLPIVTPEMFNAVGDGVADDTTAFQNCCNSGRYILCKEGANYRITDTITLHGNLTIDFNSATLTSEHRHAFYNFITSDVFSGYKGNGNIIIENGTIIGGGCSFGHGENIFINNMNFRNCINDHMIEICACKHFTIQNCTFKGMRTDIRAASEYVNIDPCFARNFPWFDNPNAYDGTPNTEITVDNSLFSVGDEPLFSYGTFAFGCHSSGAENLPNHSKIKFTNNIVEKGFSTFCLRLNCMNDVVVTGNEFKYDATYAIQMGSWEVCNNIYINGNNFIQSYNGSTSFVFLMRDAGVNELAIFDNSYDRIGKSSAVIRLAYFDITNDTVLNIVKMDKLNIPTLTNISPPITAFNRMEIQTGAPGTGSYYTNIISSFYSRNFAIGETYPIICIVNGQIEIGSIKITDAHTITSNLPTGGSLRNLTLYKDNVTTTA